ncbi:carbohydrate ABC transporter permease [uncultured Robinsoniella sp.]|uniref:carbohydrate ABC transporter permease n=1 Tax=uncultured Robinsoniella sp. TaxID=904190 RepID=UPI00374F4BFE
MEEKTSFIKILSYIAVVGVAIICLAPFWLIVAGSFSSESDIINYGYSLWPRNFSLASYQLVFQIPSKIIDAYKVSITVTVAGTTTSLLITAMTAYVLMRKDFKYRNQIAMLFYFPTIFSGGMLPSYLLISKYLGLKNNILALILPGLLSAWNIFMMRNFMRDIPDSLMESAKLDGANDFQIFSKIYLPLSKAGLATIGLFIALGYWNNWSDAMLYMDKPAMYPLQYLLYSMLASMKGIQQAAALAGIAMPAMPTETFKMAMALVTTGPILLVYPFVQRYFVKGVTIGAVKG